MGRVQSSAAHERVLRAAQRLFASGGVDATSMDAISKASGVSKATIYKHWADKDALCVAVMKHLVGADRIEPQADSGDLRTDLIGVLDHRPESGLSELRARIMPHLVAYAARKPSLRLECRENIFGPQRRALRRLLERGAAGGALKCDMDLDLSIALLLGPMMYTRLLHRLGAAPMEGIAARVVDAFLNAHARPGDRRPRQKRKSLQNGKRRS